MKIIQSQKVVQIVGIDTAKVDMQEYVEDQLTFDIAKLMKAEGLIEFTEEEENKQKITTATTMVMTKQELKKILSILERIKTYYNCVKPIEAIKYILLHGTPEETKES